MSDPRDDQTTRPRSTIRISRTKDGTVTWTIIVDTADSEAAVREAVRLATEVDDQLADRYIASRREDAAA
jgi:hypothetical protein